MQGAYQLGKAVISGSKVKILKVNHNGHSRNR